MSQWISIEMRNNENRRAEEEMNVPLKIKLKTDMYVGYFLKSVLISTKKAWDSLVKVGRNAPKTILIEKHCGPV